MTLAEITVFYAVCNIEHITIINASLKFFKKMPVQKEIFRFHENPISIANLLINALILIQSLVPQNLLYHFRLFHIHLFILSFCSNHIWLDIWARKVYLKTLRAHSNIQGTRRALGNLYTLRVLEYSDWTPVLGHLRYLGTEALSTLSTAALVHVSTRDTLFSKFVHLWKSLHHTVS